MNFSKNFLKYADKEWAKNQQFYNLSLKNKVFSSQIKAKMRIYLSKQGVFDKLFIKKGVILVFFAKKLIILIKIHAHFA